MRKLQSALSIVKSRCLTSERNPKISSFLHKSKGQLKISMWKRKVLPFWSHYQTAKDNVPLVQSRKYPDPKTTTAGWRLVFLLLVPMKTKRTKDVCFPVRVRQQRKKLAGDTHRMMGKLHRREMKPPPKKISGNHGCMRANSRPKSPTAIRQGFVPTFIFQDIVLSKNPAAGWRFPSNLRHDQHAWRDRDLCLWLPGKTSCGVLKYSLDFFVIH